MKAIIERIKTRLKTNAVIVGAGNSLKADDGVGPYVVNALAGRAGKACPIRFIDAGRMPENYIGKILTIRPQVVIVIDAAQTEAGDISIIECEDIKDTTISTHNISLKLFMRQIKDAGIDIFMIGIRPRSIALGEGLTPQAERTAEEFIKEFGKLLEEICTR